MFAALAGCRCGAIGGTARGLAGNGDAGSGHQQLGIGDVVELQQAVGGGAKALGELRHGFAFFHRVGRGGQGLGCRSLAGVPATTHHQPLANAQFVGITDAVEPHQAVHTDAGPIGNVGEGVAFAHRDGAAATGAATGAIALAGAGRTAAAGDHQGLPCRHHVGVGDAVGLHQALEADAIAIGDFRKGFTGLHHHPCAHGCRQENRQW